MADSTSAATAAAPVPEQASIDRAERFTRERFVHDGETVASALAPGTARRRALDAALRELDDGAEVPSTKWRRRYALLLGLERLLSEDVPVLADGTTLNPHQVDALSGTLTALLAAAQGNGAANATPAPVLAFDDLPVPPAQDAADRPQPVAQDEPEPDDPDEDDEDDDEEEDDEPLPELELDLDDDEDEDDEEEAEPEAESWDDDDEDVDDDIEEGAADDPNAHKRFWFEHATGAGKTVAAMGFVEASRTGGVLILTHRRNLVDQFLGELHQRGYAKRESPPLLDGEGTGRADGPVTVETYQWFVRNAGRISDAYTIVICDEAHTALGEKTSAAIRAWTGPIFIGMTATGALIARHVTDLFPTQTSRFDLAQAARRGVIAPLRCLRIPPGPGVRTIAKVPLRRGEVDVEFDQEMLAELLDQLPFNLAIADLYKTRFNGVPGVVYAAGVRHAYNVAEAFRDLGIKAEAVSGETPKRELAEILAKYERGEIDVLVNAQLLAEGWNSPRATICMHLAPTASKRIYQQRVGRVTRRHPGKEAGLVVDFVHPATKHDDPVVTLHSLLDRDVYRGGAIVVGPVRRGRGRRVRVERRVVPVTAEEERRHEVFERELWRIAVELLDFGEQHMWAALAGARVAPSGWRRARAMLHFDRTGDLKRRFLLTAVERNRNAQLRVRALQEIAAAKDAEAFDLSIDVIGTWSREERREGTKVMFQALAEKRIGRRDQANAWIWRLAEYTREVHEEYAVQRWPETKRLLGLLVNASGGAHARNARRLVHASRKQDRRLQAALLAAAVAHTPEAEEVLRGARTRLARKPSALSRELLRNFPKGRGRRSRRRRKKGGDPESTPVGAVAAVVGARDDGLLDDRTDDVTAEGQLTLGEGVERAERTGEGGGNGSAPRESRSSRRRRARRRASAAASPEGAEAVAAGGDEGTVRDEPPAAREGADADGSDERREPVSPSEAEPVADRPEQVELFFDAPADQAPVRDLAAEAEHSFDGRVGGPSAADEAPSAGRRPRRRVVMDDEPMDAAHPPEPTRSERAAPKARRTRRKAAAPVAEAAAKAGASADVAEAAPKPKRTRRKAVAEEVPPAEGVETGQEAAAAKPKATRTRSRAKSVAEAGASEVTTARDVDGEARETEATPAKDTDVGAEAPPAAPARAKASAAKTTKAKTTKASSAKATKAKATGTTSAGSKDSGTKTAATKGTAAKTTATKVAATKATGTRATKAKATGAKAAASKATAAKTAASKAKATTGATQAAATTSLAAAVQAAVNGAASSSSDEPKAPAKPRRTRAKADTAANGTAANGTTAAATAADDAPAKPTRRRTTKRAEPAEDPA